MKIKLLIYAAFSFLAASQLIGCSKQEFLNEKPRKSIVIPSTLEHLQGLLERDDMLNGLDGQGLTPQLGESGSDNFYLLDANFNGNLRPQMQNYYIWSAQPYTGVAVLDWEYPYRGILYTNSVLGGLEDFGGTDYDEGQVNSIKGQALFHRAHLYYQLAQVFAPPYDIDGANDDPGLPLRLSADINELLKRSSVGETYDLIVGDLRTAAALLGTEAPYKHRPSKQAAYALLARVYLTMRDYGNAKLYADSCLAIQNDLLDYNLVNTTATQPFRVDGYNSPINKEVIFMSAMLSAVTQGYPTTFNYSLVDSNLLRTYHEDDLRRSVFFDERPEGYRFKGSYNFINGRTSYFSGLAVDEVLLVKAECNARLGKTGEALRDLNTLLGARWKENTFTPYENVGSEEALALILEERRKELLYRGLRWSDIRRLNQEGHNISLKRSVNGETYVLAPGDLGWVWPFPLEVMVDR